MCDVNMVLMFKRGIVAIGYAFCILLNTMTVFYISLALFFLVTCYYSEETMRPAGSFNQQPRWA